MNYHEYETLRKIVGTSLDSPGMGGNISIKYDDCLVVKSSGQDMKKPHFATVISDSPNLNFSFKATDNKIERISALKPSMEWKMHRDIPSKYVLHYHPIYVLPYLCSDYDFEFGDVIDYVTPGDDLSDAIRNLQKVKELDNIIFLRNHGVVIHGDSIQEVQSLYNKVKFEFFIQNTNSYTPDDVVDTNSSDLYLFRHYMEYFAQKHGFTLNKLSTEDKQKLLNNDDEKYRQAKVK